MSFLYLSGEKYHCTHCKNTAVVNYQRVGEYQVGDMNVIMQRELKEKYSEPEDDTLYIIEAICRKCVIMSGNFLIIGDDSEVSKKIMELNKYLNKCYEVIEPYLNSYIINFDAALIKEYFTRTISDIPAMNKTKGELLNLRSRKMKERILSKIYDDVNNSEEFTRWKSLSKSTAFDLNIIAKRTQNHQLFIEIDTHKERSLNPIIEYEMTVAMPTQDEQNLRFYHPYNDEMKCFQEQVISETHSKISKIQREITKLARPRIQDFRKFLSDKGIDEEQLLVEIN